MQFEVMCIPGIYNMNVVLFLFICPLGKNVVHQLSVSLEEMYNGSTRKLGLQKNVICEKCEGEYQLNWRKKNTSVWNNKDI